MNLLYISKSERSFRIIILATLIILFTIIFLGCSRKETNNSSREDQYELLEYDKFQGSAGYEELMFVYDTQTGLYGLYDTDTKTYIVDPEYVSISQFADNGLAVACLDGYYGYINSKGEVAVDFYFENAQNFQNGYAIIGLENGQGLINESGDYVIQPQYEELVWLGDTILQYKDETTELYGICDVSGNILSNPEYEGMILEGDYIFAQIEDEENEFFVFNKDGFSIFGEGTSLEQVQCIEQKSYGIYLAKCQGVSEPNIIGFSYTGGTYDDTWYSYLDGEFNMLSYGPYQDAKQFNSNGYAVISLRQDDWGNKTWGVIDKEGNYICSLPELHLGRANNFYTVANGYFVIGEGYTGTYGMDIEKRMALVSMTTGEIVEYESITFVDDSDYTIVQDINTNLFGMYDGNKLVLECVYDNIEVDTNKNIVTKRGAKEEIYNN